jgi:hypothetical protein
MNRSVMNPVAAENIAAAHARTLLDHWSQILEADTDIASDALAELTAAADLYGVRPHPEPQVVWSELKKRLEAHIDTPVVGDPTAQEQAEIKKARRATARRPYPPTVRKRSEGPGAGLVPSHTDGHGWKAQLAAAFGTRSGAVLHAFVDQLVGIVKDDPGAVKLNAALAMISSMKPRTEMEAALLAQMVAIHWLFMDAAASTHKGNCKGIAALTKLARTFSMQMDTWSRLRGRTGRQNIKVKYERHNHQHVHMHGGVDENGGQAHVPTDRPGIDFIPPGQLAGRPALPRQDQGGNVVSGPGRKRTSAV